MNRRFVGVGLGRRMARSMSGGGGAPVDPIIALSPHSRWRSDYGVEGATSGTMSWTDMANGRLLVQATADNKPTVVNNVLNGHPVLRFDGVNDRLVSTLAASAWTFLHDGTGMELYIVLVPRFASGDGSNRYFSTGHFPGSAPCFSLGKSSAGTMNNRLNINNASQSIIAGSEPAAFTQDVPMFSHVFAKSGLSPNEWSNTPNDTTSHVGNFSAAPSSAAPNGTLHIGSSVHDGVAGLFAKVDIAEILLWDSVLSSGQRDIVTYYLASRYGL